jgi:hypothetical protein
MPLWIAGAILVGSGYQANQARKAANQAAQQQAAALAQQQADSETMRMNLQKQSDLPPLKPHQ